MKRVGHALAAVAIVFGGITVAPATASPRAVRILAVGDSKTEPEMWQHRWDLILTAKGVPHRIFTRALSGTRCDYWAARIDALLVRYRPDLVVILCGTNDATKTPSTVEPAVRHLINASRNSGAEVLTGTISYSDPNRAPADLCAGEPGVNRILTAEFRRHRHISVADLRPLPSGPAWTYDGIHGTWRQENQEGRLLYDAVRARMGWPRR